MFFKKKKVMSEQTIENIQDTVENADKLTHDQTSENDTQDVNTENELADNQAEEALQKLQAELEEVKDKHLRLIAEFDNFRRRIAKEKIELTQTAGKDIIQSLLVVLDDMGRAEKQLETTDDLTAIKEGIALVFNKMRTILQHKGLKMMEANNVEFDADLHEAITEIPAPSEDKAGKILDVVEPGYYLNDRLIRFAKVVVGK